MSQTSPFRQSPNESDQEWNTSGRIQLHDSCIEGSMATDSGTPLVLPGSVEVPSEFLCPITLSIMEQPLCNRAGLSFERRAILAWLEDKGTCPLTRQPMKPSDLIPHRALEIRIQFFLRRHGLENDKVGCHDDVRRELKNEVCYLFSRDTSTAACVPAASATESAAPEPRRRHGRFLARMNRVGSTRTQRLPAPFPSRQRESLIHV